MCPVCGLSLAEHYDLGKDNFCFLGDEPPLSERHERALTLIAEQQKQLAEWERRWTSAKLQAYQRTADWLVQCKQVVGLDKRTLGLLHSVLLEVMAEKKKNLLDDGISEVPKCP